MTHRQKSTVALTVATLITAAAAVSAEAPPLFKDPPPLAANAARPEPPKIRQVRHASPVIPAMEPAVTPAANASFATAAAFSPAGVTANAQTLSAPVTISYSGSSSALQVTDTGTGKAIQANINNGGNNSSALYGATNGGGAGLTGYNGGTSGPAGKFGVTNAASAQAGVFATTNGTGAAVLGTVTNALSNYPAIYGQNATSTAGIGVEGDGGEYGVYGLSTSGAGILGVSESGPAIEASTTGGDGLIAESATGIGVYSNSSSGIGVYGVSGTSNGVSAYSVSGDALQAITSNNGNGVYAHAGGSGSGVVGNSATGYGVWGQSKNTIAVLGQDSGSGYGIYGYSATGVAGMFSGTVQANTYITLSDRNAKTDIHPVDGKDLLARIDQLSIASWKFKNDTSREHVGPMAQDFHAVFALAGDDDTHINVTDVTGISLAAIQELSKEVEAGRQQMQKDHEQLTQKDAQIAALERKVETLEDTLSARLAALEQDVSVARAAQLSRTQTLRGVGDWGRP